MGDDVLVKWVVDEGVVGFLVIVDEADDVVVEEVDDVDGVWSGDEFDNEKGGNAGENDANNGESFFHSSIITLIVGVAGEVVGLFLEKIAGGKEEIIVNLDG